MSGSPATAPSPAPSVVTVRPAPGLGRGPLEGPTWLVALLGLAALALTLGFYARRWRERRQTRL